MRRDLLLQFVLGGRPQTIRPLRQPTRQAPPRPAAHQVFFVVATARRRLPRPLRPESRASWFWRTWTSSKERIRTWTETSKTVRQNKQIIDGKISNLSKVKRGVNWPARMEEGQGTGRRQIQITAGKAVTSDGGGRCCGRRREGFSLSRATREPKQIRLPSRRLDRAAHDIKLLIHLFF